VRKASRTLLVALVLGLTVVIASASIPAPASVIVTPEEHRRGPEQTFLTYPEWFLVHSPAELAVYLKSRPPSEFPFIGHIKQFWQGYRAVYDATKDTYPFNFGYHVMIMVIGTSTTVEYTLKYVYETMIGRLTELVRTHGMTEEDVLAAKVAQDYVDFIRVYPWYEYDFAGKLGQLWGGTSLFGPDMLRKWERKYALTTEYGAKAIYGIVIKKLTKMSYEAPLMVTATLIDKLPHDAQTLLPDLKVLKVLDDQSVLVTIPRYEAFKQNALVLAKLGVQFIEIAGNRGVILVSILVPADWKPVKPAQVLFAQPILSQPQTKRIVMTVQVAQLNQVLLEYSQPPYELEHVYDY
jgi:hypothetical protein